jgi:DNA-binding Lrp family transcriptional regulator
VARKKLKSATDQRKFTLVYNDFLESDLLNYYEKMVFITLKKFADNDTMRAFPSLKTIHKITGISLSQVRRSIDHMEELGVISIEHRIDKDKGHQSNIYTLYDYAEIWNVGSSEDVAAVADEVSEMKLVAELRAKGYTVIKEKEPDTTEPTKDQLNQALELNQFDIVNTTTNSQKSQEVERYSLEQIRILYDYDVMISDNPYQKHDIDSVISILHTSLNTTKATIRIGGEDKPSMVVIGKLMKLTYSGIMYAIEKFKEQTERIKNPTSYMLTLLYNAEEQMNLDIANKVQHDMYHWNPPTDE